MSIIFLAKSRNQSAPCPLVVSAAVPMRIPDVSTKRLGSFGIPFLFTVILCYNIDIDHLIHRQWMYYCLKYFYEIRVIIKYISTLCNKAALTVLAIEVWWFYFLHISPVVLDIFQLKF